MEIKTLETRIENTSKKLEKLNAKMARIEIALNGGANPYYYNEGDMRRTKKEIEQAENSLAKYRVELEIEINKENAPKIEVIVEFLKHWREQAYQFYANQSVKMQEAYEAHKANDAQIDKIEDYRERRIADRKEYKRWQEELKTFDSLTISIHRYGAPYFNEEELNKELDREVKRKYEDLVARVTKVVGEIKDCSNLKIGKNGSINGIVIGSEAKALVETILAGGYNIQCLHYRVLVNKIVR